MPGIQGDGVGVMDNGPKRSEGYWNWGMGDMLQGESCEEGC